MYANRSHNMHNFILSWGIVDATDMLSSHDASVSMVIPFVTTVIESLETENPAEERGVLTLKRSLATSMKER